MGICVPVPAFVRAEVLRRIWRCAGWPEGSMSAERWRRLAALVRAREVPRVEIGAGVTMATESYFLVLRRVRGVQAASRSPVPIESIALEVPGSAVVPWAGGRVVATLPARRVVRRVRRPRPGVPPLDHPRGGAGRSVRAAGDGGQEHGAGRLLPRPACPARPARGHPPGLRSRGHHLGRRPSHCGSGPADRRDEARTGPEVGSDRM